MSSSGPTTSTTAGPSWLSFTLDSS